MSHKITRRDYLNGVAFFLAGAATVGCSRSAPTTSKTVSAPTLPADYYPPTLTGLRGSHEGSYEVAHDLAWSGEKPTEYADLDEQYDLVVVGAGISGIAAAYLYQQQAGNDKRILLLDNHDDFGGHAKRNEFHSQAQMILSAGGSGNFQNAFAYSAETKNLLADLGFDLDKIRAATEPNYFGSPQGMFLRGAGGEAMPVVNGEWLSAWHGIGDYREMVNALSLPAAEKDKVISFIEGTLTLQKELPDGGASSAIDAISYKEFLTDYVGLADETCALWHSYVCLSYLVGIDCLSIREGILNGLPGLSVLGADTMDASGGNEGLGIDTETHEYDIVWMPDGNASLVRQMVRRMIPNVAPGSSIDDLVDARFDYSQLDQADNNVRVRLSSMVVNVANNEDQSVSISYVQQGKTYRVRASHCILAGYNSLIPHICPELPETQKQNLLYGVKGPMLSANILLRDGAAFYEVGSEIIQCPNSPFSLVTKAPPTSLGNYKISSDPADPMVIYMLGAPAAVSRAENQTARDLFRAGRYTLFTKPFEAYEREIREQLTGILGPKGFDADRDIEAITLNRWPHGYAYSAFSLFDPKWPAGEAPNELGRKPIGRISIANSDSEYLATVNGAVNAAWRAVQEQLS
ncbi:MAG: NAD(P)-binding protein [Pseudomonadota bacterium]